MLHEQGIPHEQEGTRHRPCIATLLFWKLAQLMPASTCFSLQGTDDQILQLNQKQRITVPFSIFEFVFDSREGRFHCCLRLNFGKACGASDRVNQRPFVAKETFVVFARTVQCGKVCASVDGAHSKTSITESLQYMGKK